MPSPHEAPRSAAHPADTHPGTPPGWAADRELVQRVLAVGRAGGAEAAPAALDADPDLQEFVRRMACLPPFLASRNRAFGRPFSDDELPDLVQDVLVIVWRRLESFAGRSALETWACGIALFELRNAVRRQRRRQDREQPLPENDPRPAPEPDDALDVEALHLALADLPGEDADLLRLKHHDELSFPELGQRLSLSTSGAKNRYYRILERLRARLAPRGDGPEPLP